MPSVRWAIRSAAGPGLLIAEQLSGLFARDPPVDLGPLLVGLAVPSFDFPLQLSQIRNPPASQTLPRDKTKFDFRLIEPTPVLGSVMDGKPIPERSALFFAEVSDQRFATVDIQVIHYEMDGLSLRVVLYDALHQTG